MKIFKLVIASMVLTCLAMFPVVSLAEEDLEVTMDVIDNLSQVEGVIIEMSAATRGDEGEEDPPGRGEELLPARAVARSGQEQEHRRQREHGSEQEALGQVRGAEGGEEAERPDALARSLGLRRRGRWKLDAREEDERCRDRDHLWMPRTQVFA